jgi:hypothetical protein
MRRRSHDGGVTLKGLWKLLVLVLVQITGTGIL